MDYLLIHGYGVGANYLNIHKAEGINGGFGAFDKLILEQNAIVFRWDIKRYFEYKTMFNPFNHLALYNQERSKAQLPETHLNLKLIIERYKPESIICHSVGSLLMTSFLKDNSLPSYVKNIVFIQADIPNNTQLPGQIKSLIKNKNLNITNLYCPWDQALLTTLPLHFTLKAGLVGYKNPLIKNIFFPLYKKTNLHTSSINDPDLIKLLEKILKK